MSDGEETIKKRLLSVLRNAAVCGQCLCQPSERIVFKSCGQHPPHGMSRVGWRDQNIDRVLIQTRLYAFEVAVCHTRHLVLAERAVIRARRSLLFSVAKRPQELRPED